MNGLCYFLHIERSAVVFGICIDVMYVPNRVQGMIKAAPGMIASANLKMRDWYTRGEDVRIL